MARYHIQVTLVVEFGRLTMEDEDDLGKLRIDVMEALQKVINEGEVGAYLDNGEIGSKRRWLGLELSVCGVDVDSEGKPLDSWVGPARSGLADRRHALQNRGGGDRRGDVEDRRITLGIPPSPGHT